MKNWATGIVALSIAMSANAQSVAPIAAVPVETAATVLPRNTQVVMTLNETLNTKSKRNKKGETFTLSVARNVLLNGYVVIPRGSRAIGSIAWRTGKGAFGKSGKMEISFDYVEVGDERIPIEGRFREEAEGNSTATVLTFTFLSMLGSGLITGRSAEIPQGREFVAWTKEEVPVRFVGPGPSIPAATRGVLDARPMPSPNASGGRRRNPDYVGPNVVCETCRN